VLLGMQVTRSLGDFYLKSQEFQCPPLYTKFRLRHELTQPALICTPSVASLRLTPHHKFVIFATDGLWDHVSNQEAVDIVQSYPRKVQYCSVQSHVPTDSTLRLGCPPWRWC